MERVWMSEFRRIFSSFYNELWSIQPVERKPTGIKLHMFVDSAKVRFCCDVSVLVGVCLISILKINCHTEMWPQLDLNERSNRVLV